MIRKHKYTIIAVIAVLILVLSLMTAALLSGRQHNTADISGGSLYAAAPAAIEHNFGKEPEGHTPEGQPISTEQELLSFFTNDVPKAYFRNNIVLSSDNVGAKLSNRVMNAGKVLDGNGFRLSMTVPGGGGWDPPNQVDVNYGDGVFVDVIQQDDSEWRGNKVRASGGLLAFNKGTIKNLQILVELTNHVYLDHSEKESIAVSPIIGVNAGFIQNVDVKLSGNYKFSMHKNDVTSNSSYMRTLMMGGLVGMSSGVIEQVSLDMGIAELEAQVKSSNWHAHSMLGGIIGKVMTSKVEKFGVEGVQHAIVRDLVITGGGILNAYLTGGTDDGIVNVGAAIGNNQIKYPSSQDANNNESDPNKFGVGYIDGIINGFEGTYKNNATILGHKATIGCGVAGNILYAFSYDGSAAGCGHSGNDGAQFHKKVGHSVAANPFDTPQDCEIILRIDSDLNADNPDSFNVSIIMSAPQDSEHLIYSADERTYKVSVTDNDKVTDLSRTPIGGWARANVNSDFDYWNAQTADGELANNYKTLEYRHSEAREKHVDAGAWDSTHTDITLRFGKEAKVNFDSSISQNMAFSNANPEITVTNKAGGQIPAEADELHYLSDFISPDGGNGYSVNSLYMPGTYSNVRIVSEQSNLYGYINEDNRYVAPLVKFDDHIGSEGAQINIAPLKFAFTSAPEDGRIYNEFTFEYAITEPGYNGEYDSMLSVLYGTNGLLPSNNTNSLSSYTVNKSTNPNGNSYVFAGYAQGFHPAAYYPGHKYWGENEDDGPAPSISTRLTDKTEESRLIIDNDAPIIVYCDAEGNTTSAPSLDQWQDSAEDVYFKVNDAHSASPSVTYAAGGDEPITLSANDKRIFTFTISDNRDYVITATDGTGNSMTETIRLPIDNVEPQLSMGDYTNGDSAVFSENTEVEFNITVGGSGYVIEVSKDGGTTYELLADTAAYTFDTNCQEQEYIFRLTTEVKGADNEFKSAGFTLIITMTKGVITLTNDAIISTKGTEEKPYVGVKIYDGTTEVSDALKSDFKWNEESVLYEQLKDMQFEASFKTAIGIGGVGIEGGNSLIFKPIDPSGKLQFEGEIVYPHASITPRSVTIEIKPANRQYGDVNPQFEYDIHGLIDSDIGLEIFESRMLVSSAVVGSNVGEYAITFSESQEELTVFFKLHGYHFTTASIIENGMLTIAKRVLDSDLHIDTETVNGVDYTGSEIAIKATYDYGGSTMPLEAKYYTVNDIELAGAPINVGSYYAVLQVPNDNFVLSESVRRYEIIIHEAYVAISVDGAANKIIEHKYNNEPYTVNYSTSAEGSVTVTYIDSDGNESNTAPANVGEYKIGFRIIPADTSFKETYVEYTLNITKANFITDAGLTFDSKKVEFNGEYIYLELLKAPIGSIIDITILGIAPNTDYVIDNINGTFGAIGVGIYDVMLNIANTNYEDLSIQAKLEITQAQMNIVFESKQYVYNGSAHSIEVLGVPEGGRVSLKVNAVDESNLIIENDNKLISAINAGKYAVTATVICDGWVAKTVSAVLTVTPAKMVGVTFASYSADYDGNEHSISVGGTLPPNAKCSITVNDNRYDSWTFSAVEAGSYRATASVSAPNYETLTIRANLDIKPLNLRNQIDVSIFNVTYDGNAHAFVISLIDGITDVTVDVRWTVNGVEEVINRTISGSDTISIDFVNADTYKFRITVSKDNYTTSAFNAECIIREAQFHSDFEGARSVTYDGTAHVVKLINVPLGADVEWTAGDGVVVDSDGLQFFAINAGSYVVTVNLSMDNYANKKMTYTLTINGANVGEVIEYNNNPVYEWSPNGSEFQINNLPEGGTIAFDISENENGGIEVVDGKIKVTNVGSYSVTFIITAPNYNTYTKRITLTVTRANFSNTVVFEDNTVDYDGNEHSIELMGIPEGAEVTFVHNGNAVEPTADGRYIFTQTEAGGYIVHYTLKRDNYNSIEGSATLTINQLTMDTSMFVNFNAVYNGTEHTYTIMDKLPANASFELLSDLPNGIVITDDGVIRATNAIAGIRIQLKLKCPNYNSPVVTIRFTIDKATLSDLNVDDKTATFNESKHSISVEGVKDGDTVNITSQSEGGAGVSIDGNTFNATHAGKYVVKFEVSRGNNYNAYSKTVTLTINKAQLPGEFKYLAPEVQWVEGGGPYTAKVVNADGTEIDAAKYKVVWSERGNVFVNAGTYALSARVESLGANFADYETYQVKNVDEESGAESSFINFVIKHAVMTNDQMNEIVMDSKFVEFDNKEHSIDVKGPEGFDITVSGNKLTNAGSNTVIATFTRANYEPVTRTCDLVISPRKVVVEFIIMPSYVVGEEPLVIGKYTDIEGKNVNFKVDTSSVDYEVEGSYEVTCSYLGNRNYVASNAEEEMTFNVIIGTIKSDLNIGGIVGGSVGGSAAVIGGGIAALLIILRKKKIRL